MFAGLQKEQVKGALEALLFVTDEPVNTITLADMLEVEPACVERALVDLAAQLEEENRGIVVREVAGGWRLYTHPAYHELIEKYVLSWDVRKLSQAALEVLSIIAYGQPITRAGVAGVRGVNSDSSINSLVEKGLVREAGTDAAPGNPVLYATTSTFLEKFGLRSTADLPDLESYAPDDETRAFIRERLSATKPEIDGAIFRSGEETALFAFGDAVSTTKDHQSLDAPISFSEEEGNDMRHALSDALAQSVGVVEKIDFNELHFED
ncbi:MAG: SMC-Scp complex subunit ScpB [Raoultibacter sp.]